MSSLSALSSAVAGSAAVITIAIVAVIPPPSAAVASAAVDLQSPGVATVASAKMPAARAATDETGCTEAWPYYEQPCLRTAGKGRVVRVIADDRSATTSTGEVERMRQQIKEALEPSRGSEVSSMPKTARSKATHVGLKVRAKSSGSATTPPNTNAGFAEARSAKAEEKDPKRALRHRGPSPVLVTLVGSSGRRP